MKKRWKRLVSAIVLSSMLCTTSLVVNAEELLDDSSGLVQTEEDSAQAEDTYPAGNDSADYDNESTEMDEPAAEENNTSGENEDNGVQSKENEDAVMESESQEETGTASDQIQPEEATAAESSPSVSYRAHVSEIGWQNAVKDGATGGTVGQNLPMEAISINLEYPDSAEDNSGISYEVHLLDGNWQAGVSDGAVAGTTGQAKAIEAVRIRLTGTAADLYDVYYRVHSAEYGWFDWAKNGETAGSIGFGYAMQAIEIRLYEKNDTSHPVATDKTYLADDNMGNVIYQVHMQDKGWCGRLVDGQEAGSSTDNKNLEAIKIQLSDSAKNYGELTGSVAYQVHVRDKGWLSSVADGQLAGTTGENKPIEAIKIDLSGTLKDTYDIYYRVFSQNHGWFGWAKNGELAGSVGFAYAVQAIEIKLYLKNSPDAPECVGDANLTEDNLGMITYTAHVQNIGWQKKVADGTEAGTTGKNLGIEALTVSVTERGRKNNSLSGSVVYQAHVSGIGWQSSSAADGSVAGTTGENRRIEAIKIYLTDQLAEKYDIYYRVHSSNFGWLDWTKNGETAGSTGYGSSIEAIKICLFEKNSASAPHIGSRSALSREQISTVNMQEYVENAGWMSVKQGTDLTIGTTGQNKGMRAVAMSVKPKGSSYTGRITYNAHVSDVGWQGWKQDGSIAGVVDKNIEAIQIKLEGEMEKYCDIYYRAHVSEFGWLGWAKNGESAGTSGYAYKLQALQIKIVPKYTGAPGNTSNAFKKAPPSPVLSMLARANLYSSSTPYIILVDRSTHKVGIFQGWRGAWNNMAFWDCSDGAPSTPTVEGTFKVGAKGYYFDSGNARCYWYTQFYHDYLFHSVLYNKYSGALADGRLGMALSHGCVRLDINNAKWIYDNIPSGTTVVVYH